LLLSFPSLPLEKVGTNGLLVHVSAVPCHTRGSVLFRIPGFNQRRDAVFTGDTLFCGGCGAPFEGDATSMQVKFHDGFPLTAFPFERAPVYQCAVGSVFLCIKPALARTFSI
jgi:hypothetical protein